jgi:hypothetical protein
LLSARRLLKITRIRRMMRSPATTNKASLDVVKSYVTLT